MPYLLHGALAGSGSWMDDGDAENLTAGKPLITVVPDGGVKGWYADWASPRGAAPQKWETFHIGLRSLDAAGVPHTFDDYGDGHTTGPGHCDGNHDFGCWRNDLVDVLPRILAVVRHP